MHPAEIEAPCEEDECMSSIAEDGGIKWAGEADGDKAGRCATCIDKEREHL